MPKFTREHYERVAEVFNTTLLDHPYNSDKPYEDGIHDGIKIAMFRMAMRFQADNPRFRESWFYKACGLRTDGSEVLSSE